MKSVFVDKMCSILIVIPSESVRTKVQQTLRGLGFNNFKACDTIISARKYLKVHSIDWIITTLFASEKETAIQLLFYLQNERPSSQIYVSLFLNDEEMTVLPLAFELGILSSHKSYFESDTLRNIVLKLTEQAEKLNFNPSLVAMQYYRQYLIQQRRFNTLLSLEQSVVKTYPTDSSLLINLAEAQYLANKRAEAEATLARAHMQEPDLQNAIRKLKDDFATGGEKTEIEKGDRSENYSIGAIVIVDPDEASNIAMRSVLSQLKIENIHSFNDGLSAWDWIKDHDKIDLVVMEWKLHKLTGPLLIQRIRSLEHGSMPIVVASSLVKEDDALLLEEFSVAKTLEKPIDAARFMQVLEWCVEQENSPRDQTILERKIYTALTGDRMIEAAKLKKEFENNPKIPAERKKYMDARFNYHFGNYGKAKADLVIASKHAKRESLAAITLLGKCHLRLGEFRPALNSFQKAQGISPQNIERLCKIAEVFLYMDELKEAEKVIEQAENMDAQNPHVSVVKTELAAFKSNLDVAFSIMGKVSDVSELVAFLNNHAVAITRAGERKEGIEMYQSVLKILQPNEKKNIAKVSYNLGLAHVRSGDLEPAIDALKIAAESDRAIAVKANSLLKRVEEAINTSSGYVKLNEEKQSMLQDSDSEIDFDNYEETLGPTPTAGSEQIAKGVLCLRGLISYRDEFDGLSISMNRPPEKLV